MPHRRTFEGFRDIYTSQAPFDQFATGLGANIDAGTVSDDAIKKEVDETIAELNPPQDRIINMRKILTARIKKLFEANETKSPKREASMLDIVTLGLDSDEKVKKFLKRHGIDVDKDEDREYLLRIMKEAIAYFDKHVAGKHKRQIINDKGELVEKTENIHEAGRNFAGNDLATAYEIFKTASGFGRKILVPQACALLRISACIDFMDSDPLISVLPEAEASIREFKSKHIKTIKNGQKTQVFQIEEESEKGDENREKGAEMVTDDKLYRMAIYKFEARTKTRERIITKLLHKPSNKTKEVLDHIGIRITTFSAADTIRIIYQLFFADNAVFPSMNINIGESRNRLLDKQQLQKLFSNPNAAKRFVNNVSTVTAEDLDLIDLDAGQSDVAKNQHSSSKYRAIHITFDMPIVDKNGKHVNFPVELQVLDMQSSLSNNVEAPHELYENSQRGDVADRIYFSNNLLEEHRQRNGGYS